MTLTGDRPLGSWAVVAGEFGKDAEPDRLSSNSERSVDTDLAEPELTEPVPGKNENKSLKTTHEVFKQTSIVLS